MAECQDELICDFAETYHVLNYEELAPDLVAVLLCGLDKDSRTQRKLAGIKVSMDRLILAKIADSLAYLVWAKTEDGANNINHPKSLAKALMGNQEEEDKQCESYDSEDEFRKAWNERK